MADACRPRRQENRRSVFAFIDRAGSLPSCARGICAPASSIMGLGKRALSSGEAVVDRILCVVGAVLFSQGPEFMQQYLQRLGGRLDEARRLLSQYEEIAQQAGITLNAFIARTSANPDTVVAKHAEVMQRAVTRVTDLATAQTAMQDASMFTRPFAFLRHIDMEIAASTWSIYKPAVPTTLEGLAYAGVGIGVMLAFYYGCIHFPVTRSWRKYKQRKAAKAADDDVAQAAKPARPDPPAGDACAK